MFDNQLYSDNEIISLSSLFSEKHEVSIKREDQLHPFVSGNKFRKLKYNLLKAKELKHHTVLTYGGAYSNHIAAVASASNSFGMKSIGIIRGEELQHSYSTNPTLKFAQENGMQFHFISREDYRQKNTSYFSNSLEERFGEFFEIPEGGTNDLAVVGCEEILSELDKTFDYICVSVGTGGTIAGIVKASEKQQHILGFSALKGTFQKETVHNFTSKRNFSIIDAYNFGGYAKIDSELIRFINTFKSETGISLDPIYTGKMMYGIADLMKKGFFKENSRILAVHTGGLQGITGMNLVLKKKNLPQIDV